MNDTYILLRDLPYTKAGIIYKRDIELSYSSYYPEVVGWRHERFAIHADYVENNPDWFQKVTPPEKKWTDEDLNEARKEGFSKGILHAQLSTIKK